MTTAAPRRLPPLPPRPDDVPASPVPPPGRRGPRRWWPVGIAVLAIAALLVVLVHGRGPTGGPVSAGRPSVMATAPVAPRGSAASSSPMPRQTVRVTQRVTVQPSTPHRSAPVSSSPAWTAPPKFSQLVQQNPAPVPSSRPSSRAVPSAVARSASASFTLTCPVATTLTATGSGVGSNTLTLTGPGVHRTGSGRSVSFTVQVQPGSFTASDTDSGGQPAVGLRQSVPASQACH